MRPEARLRGVLAATLTATTIVAVPPIAAIARQAAVRAPEPPASTLAGVLFDGVSGRKIADGRVFVLGEGREVLGHARTPASGLAADAGRWQAAGLPASGRVVVVGFHPRHRFDLALRVIDLDGRYRDIGELRTDMDAPATSQGGQAPGTGPLGVLALSGWIASEATRAWADEDAKRLADELMASLGETPRPGPVAPVAPTASSGPDDRPQGTGEVCALYDGSALAKAKDRFGLDAHCDCRRTERVCDRNWRGAHKRWYECRCRRTPPCSSDVCAGNRVTATVDAAGECGKTSCDCRDTGRTCGSGVLGAKHTYHCECP